MKKQMFIICALALGVSCISLVSAADKPIKKDNKNIEMSVQRWSKFLVESGVKIGLSSRDISRIMQGVYRDKGIIYWGGSGNHSLCYQIDDMLEIRFLLDKDEKLLALPDIRAKSLWLKDPKGDILVMQEY
jgi:hypothetical protein